MGVRNLLDTVLSLLFLLLGGVGIAALALGWSDGCFELIDVGGAHEALCLRDRPVYLAIFSLAGSAITIFFLALGVMAFIPAKTEHRAQL